MELKIEYIAVDNLKPYERNTRKHEKKDVDNIAKSIENMECVMLLAFGAMRISLLRDTAIFITIAFVGTVPNIFTMIASQYLIKLIYAALDTPFFYLLTNKKRSEMNGECE